MSRADFCNDLVEFAMFEHILIPTDGSELSKIAIKNGVQFAKELNAKVTGLTVTPPFHFVAIDAIQVSNSPDTYTAQSQELAERHLQVLKDAARKAGVPCEVVHRVNEHPYEEIVKTAQEQGCDVIFQASHGRRGVSAVVLGSETNKVLTHSKIPVLVFR
ncbi:MAG TPA: universal stress protein [Polaromonas sp.]|jgi:nucleotide-binding universal stress UspA family protein|nr:universal stress protein [Polaromonas sp.]